MYDPTLVQPMREELSRAGFQELKTAEEVDQVLGTSPEPILVVVNSVCGCAAGAARPGARLAASTFKKPIKLATVFAGQDKEATERVRSYFMGYPPSSPCFALLKDGEVIHFVGRHLIEGNTAEQIAEDLVRALNELL